MALVVEDGTGLATAESYISVANADTYFTNYVRGKVEWSGASDAVKERSLREATQTLDALFGTQFKGKRIDGDQALLWPRSSVVTSDGYTLASNAVPTAIERATCELAWKHVTDAGPDTTTGDTTGVIPDSEEGENLVKEKVKVGPIEEEREYAGQRMPRPLYNKVRLILAELILPRGTVIRA